MGFCSRTIGIEQKCAASSSLRDSNGQHITVDDEAYGGIMCTLFRCFERRYLTSVQVALRDPTLSDMHLTAMFKEHVYKLKGLQRAQLPYLCEVAKKINDVQELQPYLESLLGLGYAVFDNEMWLKRQGDFRWLLILIETDCV